MIYYRLRRSYGTDTTRERPYDCGGTASDTTKSGEPDHPLSVSELCKLLSHLLWHISQANMCCTGSCGVENINTEPDKLTTSVEGSLLRIKYIRL